MSSRPIESARAGSYYRQLRITATHELNGSLSLSIHAKPLNAQWSEQTCILRQRVDLGTQPLQSIEDVLGACIAILRSQMLPGIG